MAVAPEIFDTNHAIGCLKIVEEELMQ